MLHSNHLHFFFFSSRRRHTRYWRDWSQTCALPISLGVHPSPAEWRAHAGGRDVDRLFWSLMLEPTPVSTSAAWVDRLLDRLVLLHACYEQAMAQLRPAGTPGTRAVAPGRGSDRSPRDDGRTPASGDR